jgi:hypothetical protein
LGPPGRRNRRRCCCCVVLPDLDVSPCFRSVLYNEWWIKLGLQYSAPPCGAECCCIVSLGSCYSECQKLVLGTVLRRMMLQASPCLRPFSLSPG